MNGEEYFLSARIIRILLVHVPEVVYALRYSNLQNIVKTLNFSHGIARSSFDICPTILYISIPWACGI
jgi:hypothetical protein